MFAALAAKLCFRTDMPSRGPRASTQHLLWSTTILTIQEADRAQAAVYVLQRLSVSAIRDSLTLCVFSVRLSLSRPQSFGIQTYTYPRRDVCSVC
jgi:hypothetical protein